MPGPASEDRPQGPARPTAAVTLGLLTAIGGLVDVGNLVANPQAGAAYGLTLLPLLLVSGLIVALYSEMAGRVAAVSGSSGFEVVVEGLPPRLARANLLASVLLTVMTCAAEVGGIGQLGGYLTGSDPRVWALPVAVALAAAVVGVSFSRAERVLGLAGLTMAVVVVALGTGRVPWPRPGALFVPPGHHPAAFAYVAVAQVGSMLVPYQLVFFSSGTAEEGWGRRALSAVRSNAWIGYGCGTL
ncbi:MAG TPA: divalent metal cation transporter, partial [Acidimicrobiales bacterium]|nr:divalent metal cation transporter [Acidimicrobiales bacterium]